MRIVHLVFLLFLLCGFDFIKPWSSRKPGTGTHAGRSNRQPEHPSPTADAGRCLSCRCTRGQSKRRVWGPLVSPPTAAWASAWGASAEPFPGPCQAKRAIWHLCVTENKPSQPPSDGSSGLGRGEAPRKVRVQLLV